MKEILDYTKNKITIDEIQEYLGIEEYLELVNYIDKKVNEGILSPIRAHKGNGKTPERYLKYKIIRPTFENEEYTNELKFQLHHRLSAKYYLTHLAEYEKDRKYVLMLNQYFWKEQDNLEHAVSINERSFEIFREEKFILKGGKSILKNLNLTIEDLNVYHTTEPLAYYSHHKNVPQTILVIENKDTFYSMRKHLLDGSTCICGEEVGTIIYCGGKSRRNTFQDFELCVENYLRSKENKMLYFGDLDYEGIKIYEGLHKEMKDIVQIEPFCEAYERMIRKAQKTMPSFNKLPITKEKQDRLIGTKFFRAFSSDVQEIMKKILEQERYIPQEILQIKDF